MTPSAVGASAAGKPSAKAASAAGRTLPARWWSWAASVPDARSPVADTTGEFCGLRQPADVFFLAGTFGRTGVKRTCTVPAGRPVYFPVVNQICAVPRGQSAAKAVKGCRVPGLTRAQASLDGKPLAIKEASSGGAFTLTAAKGSVFADLAADDVAWGIWAGPLRLPTGRHTLTIAADAEQFSVGVTYTLTVG